MTIALTSEQLLWLEEQVAAGRFASLDDGVQRAMVGLMTGVDGPDETDDDDWVGPLLDDARASLARGDSMSLEDFKVHAALRRPRSD